MSLIGPVPEPVESPKYPTPWYVENGDVYSADGKRVVILGFDVKYGKDKADVAAAIAWAVNDKYGQSKPTAQEYLDYDGDEPTEGYRVPKVGDRVRVTGASLNGEFVWGDCAELVEVDSDNPKYLVNTLTREDWVYGIEAV